MNFLLVILYINCIFLPIIGMQQETKSVLVKPNDNKHYSLPLFVAQQSGTIVTKCLQKEKLSIEEHKPIVLPLQSEKELILFDKAARVKEEEFNRFYTGLTPEERINLINTVGENQLNAPGLTALVAQVALPLEIVIEKILPYLDREETAQYIKNIILRHNLNLEEIQGKKPYELIFHPSGTFHNIPLSLQPNTKVCTNRTSVFRCMRIIKDDYACGVYPVVCVKKIDDYFFYVTTDKRSNSTFIWRIYSTESKPIYRLIIPRLWDYKPDDCMMLKTYPFSIYRAEFSSNSQHIMLLEQNNIWVLTLDLLSKDTIEHIQCIPKNLRNFSAKPIFNTHLTLLASLAIDEVHSVSELILYDLSQHRCKRVNINGPAHCLRFNDDNTKLYVLLDDQQNSKLQVYNIKNIEDIYNRDNYGACYTIDLKADVVNLSYSPKHTLLAAQTSQGSVLFIPEDAMDNITLVEVPFTNKYPYYSELTFLDAHNILFSWTEDIPYITFWDTQLKRFIGKKSIYADKKSPNNIAIAEDECSFMTNNGFLESTWHKQVLWTPQEQTTIEWIKTCPTLFAAYTLQYLYKTHKNNDYLTLHPDEPMMHVLNTITSQEIKECIEKYLILKKEERITDKIDEYATKAFGYATEAYDTFMSWF